MFSRLGRLLVGGLLLGLLAGCDTSGPTTGQPVIIASVFNLTGDLATYDLPVEKGVALAIQEQNAAGGVRGRPIVYKKYDGATDPMKIAAATSQAIDDGAVALIALADTDSVMSAAPVGQKA